jgi:hypothetical protein
MFSSERAFQLCWWGVAAALNSSASERGQNPRPLQDRLKQIPPASLRSRVGMTRVMWRQWLFSRVYFRGYARRVWVRNFVDLGWRGCNHLAIAEVVDIAAFDQMVGRGFCVSGSLSADDKEASQTREYCAAESAAHRAARPWSFSDDKTVASG